MWNVFHAAEDSTTGWFMDTGGGGLNGNGKCGDDEAGSVLEGQVLTMQVDLNKGTLKFWVDGKPHGPGYTHGVTGPVQWSAEMVPTPELEPWEE